MRPGNSASSTLKRSITISGAWFGSITPPEPMRMFFVIAATCPIMMSGAELAMFAQVVVLGEPVAREAERVGEAREIERVAQRLRGRRGGGDGREVEDREGGITQR